MNLIKKFSQNYWMLEEHNCLIFHDMFQSCDIEPMLLKFIFTYISQNHSRVTILTHCIYGGYKNIIA